MGAVDLLLSRATLRNLPVAGTFELTGRCNLSCKMCYIHQGNNHETILREELSAEQWIDLAHQAQEAGTLTLLLTGGEPTLRPDFLQIYEKCMELGFVLTINTNGTLLREEILESFRKHPPFRVNMSLYGTSPETYERLCGRGAVYETVMSNLKKLREIGVNVKLNFSATPYNHGDIAEAYRTAKELGVPMHFVSYMFPAVRREEEGSCTASRFTPFEAANANVDYIRAATPPEELQALSRLIADRPMPRAEDCISDADPSIRCRAGRGAYWLTYRGDMLGCGMIPHIKASATELGFTPAWQQVVQEYKKVAMPAGCASCPEYERCEVCPAICFAENRDLEHVPQYICEKNRAYREILEKIGRGEIK